jgi:hypothetical protein
VKRRRIRRRLRAIESMLIELDVTIEENITVAKSYPHDFEFVRYVATRVDVWLDERERLTFEKNLLQWELELNTM